MWSTCSHKCRHKYTSSPLIRLRVRDVRCVDDEKRIVQEELCEKTAEKPMDTEVRINHLLTHKNVFLINFLRTFINPFYQLLFPTETYSGIKSCPIIPDCPTWQLGPWSPCQCTNRATCSCTGEQERQVWCTILDVS